MKKLAYITTSFGSLSHTFIRREVTELRRLGLDISLFGIRPDVSEKLSAEDKNLIKETIYLYPLRISAVIAANAFFFTNRPYCYFKILLEALLNEEINIFQHSKLIYHFFVSSYIAFKMRTSRIQHIHAHFLHAPSSIAMYCSKLLNIPFSITVHSAGTMGLKEMIGLKNKLREARFICTISEYNRNYICKYISSCKEKTYVVRCGIDISDYRWRGDQDKAERLKSVKLISIGRFVEKKGFKYLMEASRVLKKEKISFTLKIIGDGPAKAEVKKMSEDFNLKDDVIFKGILSHKEVKEELYKSDILIVPSVESRTGEKEGIPVVIMEAMASGVFVIATCHSGIGEIV